ncbi:uncharacterized protein K452DRAFT_270047 [Aplosporella prunicola CBS 121167]|uniref:Uncharacterized protein n=1 Tax=Aplosporella prunicola CBS 121167 TaxID=1176127 RepID=A0A6A6BE09_9PEZI|nr:uncharacterized protein K452DRAFT_270047 [Aplosporella prunicola CBS 121167]KAF2142412.1 hypothetical protein K452DRAFT_270047 [Aplosporella prunicola CBS 121167]
MLISVRIVPDMPSLTRPREQKHPVATGLVMSRFSDMPRTPRKWTAQEDEELRLEVLSQLAEGEVKDWCKIATRLPGRNNKDCRKRWHNAVAGGLRKGQWARAEDTLLKNAVARFGQKWTQVADLVGTRSADQCAKRWQQSLDPELDRSEWSSEENRILLEAVRTVGRHWTTIQKTHFPSRSKNGIKNRYTVLTRRGKCRDSVDSNTQTANEGTLQSVSPKDENESEMGSEYGNVVDGSHVKMPWQAPTSVPMDWNFQSPSTSYTTVSGYRTPRTPSMDPSFALCPDMDPGIWGGGSSRPQEILGGNFSAWAWDMNFPSMAGGIPDLTSLEQFPQNSPRNQGSSFGTVQMPGQDLITGQLLGNTPGHLATAHASISSPKDKLSAEAPRQDAWDLNSVSGMGDLVDEEAVRVTFTLNKPTVKTMNSLMRIAMENKAGLHLQRD